MTVMLVIDEGGSITSEQRQRDGGLIRRRYDDSSAVGPFLPSAFAGTAGQTRHAKPV